MQLPWDEHFLEIVVPAWQAYLSLEAELTRALQDGNELAAKRARYAALREGGSATFYLHHFAEIVLRAQPEWLPRHIETLSALREWMAPKCTALRTDVVINDLALLNDVATLSSTQFLLGIPKRALSAVLQNVVDAWRRAAGINLPPINES